MSLMRFRNSTGNNDVTIALITAHVLLTEGSRLVTEVLSKNDWKYNSGAGTDVAAALLKEKPPIDVLLYRPWNRWTKAVGYFDGKAIHINSRALGSFTTHDIVGLLLHEYSHYSGFEHGNNYKTQDKCLYSVPYFLSENTARWM